VHDRPIRVGVIGTGFGARVVAPAFAVLGGVSIDEVVSARDQAGVKSLCSRPEVDLMCVHSPPFLHAEHVRIALDREPPPAILCDKPLATCAEESEEMLAGVERAGVLHFTNFEFRELDARRYLQAILSAGHIGEPVHMVWTHFSSGTSRPVRPFGWLFERNKGGGWVGAWASHAVDTVRWLTGEVCDATSIVGTLIGERPNRHGDLVAVDAEDSLLATLVTERDCVAVLTSSFASPAGMTPRIVLIGTNGVAECVDDRTVDVQLADGSALHWDAPGGERHMRAMSAWAAIICDCIRSGEQRTPTFADGLACDRVLEKLRAGPRIRWPSSGS
jgi:predicted dehydrogenase